LQLRSDYGIRPKSIREGALEPMCKTEATRVNFKDYTTTVASTNSVSVCDCEFEQNGSREAVSNE
jgi:hypothetical protein